MGRGRGYSDDGSGIGSGGSDGEGSYDEGDIAFEREVEGEFFEGEDEEGLAEV